jgi:hypothetical protein
MELEFAKEKKDAVDSLEKLIANAQQLSTLNTFIQDAWEALKIVLEHNQMEYDNKIKEAQYVFYCFCCAPVKSSVFLQSINAEFKN